VLTWKIVRLFASGQKSVMTAGQNLRAGRPGPDVETLTELIGQSARAGLALVVIEDPLKAGPRCSAQDARLPPCAIALANIATDSIDFTRRDSRGELPVLPADEPITPAGTARA
jgi:hypothetical protein